jgi:hypothetical protein
VLASYACLGLLVWLLPFFLPWFIYLGLLALLGYGYKCVLPWQSKGPLLGSLTCCFLPRQTWIKLLRQGLLHH